MLIKTARLQSHYCFYLMVPIAILFNVLIGYGINVHVSKKPEKTEYYRSIVNGVHLSHSRQVAHVYYQLFDSKMADGYQLWSVPKLEYDLLRRNASTNVRKTDLIERYILHRKPKHTIYVRYFSILLYLLYVQVAPTEEIIIKIMMTDQFECAFVTGFRDKIRRICHIYAIHYN